LAAEFSYCEVSYRRSPRSNSCQPLNVGIISDDVELSMEKRQLTRFLYLNEKTDTLSWSSEHMDRMIGELAIL